MDSSTAGGPGHAPSPDSSPDAAALHEVVPGVLAWVQPDGSWWINNAGAVLGDDAVTVVDTCATRRRTERFLHALDQASGGRTIRTAVNTHQHGDHTYGNSLLPAGTVLIGHRLMREGLAVDPLIDGCPPFWSPVPDWGDVHRRLPDITFTDRMTLHVGDTVVELLHPGGPAHTTGDVVAWLPGPRVLFTGDLVFHGLTPLVFMGSVHGAQAALDWIAELDPRHLVPGHGPLASGEQIAETLEAHRRYYRFLRRTADAGHANGWTPLETAQRCDLGEFAGWADAERLVPNLHRAYADASGGRVDLVAAFTDAVTWRGGPMATAV